MSTPQQSLLSALLATAIVVSVALSWFGWKTITDHALVEQQLVRERVDTSADAMAARIGGRLAEIGERLSGWLAETSAPLPAVDGAVVLAATGNRIELNPAGGLPFVPLRLPSRPLHPLLSDAEAIEFRSADAALAITRYRLLTDHPDAHVRAGALLRYARVLRKAGRPHDARAAYGALAALGSIDVDGYPAALVALDGQRTTAAATGDHEAAQRAATEIRTAIDQGRWPLSRGLAEQYRDQPGAPPKGDAWLIAGALASVADEWPARPLPTPGPPSSAGRHAPDRGLRVANADGSPVVVLWRSSEDGTVMAAGFADRLLPAAAPAGVAYRLVDSLGTRVMGSTSLVPPSAVRVIADARFPLTLTMSADGSQTSGPGLSRRAVIGMMAAVMLFLWAAVYFIARAIRREAAVARLQSDFVAAVSHEFRSPLTTVRQLSEMLEMGQVPTEDRRRKYYEVLAGESKRLQRLVETLLNFGKMEANAQRYRFEPLDLPPIVRQAARDVGRSSASAGHLIEVDGPASVPRVLGDTDALALALRNLIENAVKYSPGAERVRVDWGSEGGHVSVRVIDDGLGVTPSERAAIFQKFVRGAAAAAANVRGTGVGLAMVQHIVSAHHGEIHVQSEPGRGTTFTLQLPVVN